MKPLPMQRALDRAATARWMAGKEDRTKHIRALTTQVREDSEDYRQMEAERLLSQAELQIRIMCAAFGVLLP